MPHPEIDVVIEQVLVVGKSTVLSLPVGVGTSEDVSALQAKGFLGWSSEVRPDQLFFWQCLKVLYKRRIRKDLMQ